MVAFAPASPVSRQITDFFAPRLQAASRDNDVHARVTLIAAREIAHASEGGDLLIDLFDMPERDVECVIGTKLPAGRDSVDQAFRLAMRALELHGEDL